MTDTFSWVPSIGGSGGPDFRVRSAQFGDGYSQAVGDGLNASVQTHSLTFVGTSAKIGAIIAFLDAHSGYKSFFWTPPLSAQGLYRCAGYKNQPLGGGNFTLTATFNQVFAP